MSELFSLVVSDFQRFRDREKKWHCVVSLFIIFCYAYSSFLFDLSSLVFCRLRLIKSSRMNRALV